MAAADSRDSQTANNAVLAKMRFSQLRMVLTIVKEGTLHKAADELAVTQPALTRALQDVERALGVSLFTRTQKGMLLTDYGVRFSEHARIMLNQFQSALEQLEEIKDGYVGQVNVAMLPAVAPVIMPSVVQKLDAMNTRITMTLSGGLSRQLLPRLLSGELDMIVGRLLPAKQSELRQIPLLYDSFCVACGPHNKNFTKRRYELSDLLSEFWVIPSDMESLLMQDVLHTFSRYGLAFPADVMQVYSLQAIRKILQTTNRVGLLSASVAEEEERFGLLRILPVQFKANLTPIGITVRSNEETSPAAQLIVKLITDVSRELSME